MQDGQHDFEGGLVHLLVHVDGDSAAVVHHLDRIVLEDRNLDSVGESGECLVDGVVHHFVDEMVESAGGDVADVHRGAFPDGLKAFQHLDVVCYILFFFCF